MRPSIFLFLALSAAQHTYAQVNAPGTFQVGLGTSLGLFNTEFTNRFTVPGGIQVSNSSKDGAATFSFPIDVQIGVAKRLSLGLCLEPGRYIDSAGTHPNGFFILGIKPRFYVVNGERFGLHVNADLGVGTLRITSNDDTSSEFEDTYSGGHFRLGAQAQYFFGSTFGINFGVKFAVHTLKWKDRDPQNSVLETLNYEAELRTGGVLLQAGLQLKL